MTDSIRTKEILFTRGAPANEAIPVEDLADCFRVTLSASTLQYGANPAGFMPLREYIAGWFGVAPEQAIITNGSLHILSLLARMRCLGGEANRINLLEAPTYDRALRIFSGFRNMFCTVRGDGVEVDFTDESLDYPHGSVYTIPDFHNPTGVTLSLLKRQAVIKWAKATSALVIEDIPYRELRYQGETLPLLRDFGYENVVTMGSLSKLIAPGLRVGFAIAPLEIVVRLSRLAEDETLRPVLPTQAAVMEYLRRGLLPAQVERLKALYAPRCQAAIEAVRNHLPRASFWEPQGGFFLGILLPEEANTKNLVRRAQAANLKICDGREFYSVGFEKIGKRFVRLPFSGITSEEIEEGVRRLASLI